MKNSQCPSCGAPLPSKEGIPSRIGSLCPGCAVLYFPYEIRLFGREFLASFPLFVLPNALFWMAVPYPDGSLSLGFGVRMIGLGTALILAAVSAVLTATGVFPLFGSLPFLRGFRESQTDSSGRAHPLLWTARRPSEGKTDFRSFLSRFLIVAFLIPPAGSLMSVLLLVRGARSLAFRRRNPREILSSGQKCYPETFFQTFRHPLAEAFLDPTRHPTLSMKVGERDGEWINEGHVVFQETLFGVLRIPGSDEMVFLRLDSAKGRVLPADRETADGIRKMIESC